MKDDEKEIELIQQNIKFIEEKLSMFETNQKKHIKNGEIHENNDQKRHLETVKGNAEIKELLLSKMNHIEKYIEVRIKEHQLWVEDNYTKKIETMNINTRVGKIENVLGRAWKTVFGIIIAGLLAILFGKP